MTRLEYDEGTTSFVLELFDLPSVSFNRSDGITGVTKFFGGDREGGRLGGSTAFITMRLKSPFKRGVE